MATGLSIKLTGAIGEFLVAGELCRRGLLATPFAGNVPHYDIIASGQYGGHVAVQVKAINGPTWQFDIRKFLDAHMADDKNHQVLGSRQPEPFPDLMCVLVVLKGTGKDRFFILEWKELQDVLATGYEAYIEKKKGVRPRSPESFHTALRISSVASFENQWQKIVGRVPQTGVIDSP
ncbi:MAG TPA: hypothetical protein VKG25_04615 [Bryobacteraceae bacterium]|nr:hypothetical protein [Bryobacteraceae bacterium]